MKYSIEDLDNLWRSGDENVKLVQLVEESMNESEILDFFEINKTIHDTVNRKKEEAQFKSKLNSYGDTYFKTKEKDDLKTIPIFANFFSIYKRAACYLIFIIGIGFIFSINQNDFSAALIDVLPTIERGEVNTISQLYITNQYNKIMKLEASNDEVRFYKAMIFYKNNDTSKSIALLNEISNTEYLATVYKNLLLIGKETNNKTLIKSTLDKVKNSEDIFNKDEYYMIIK